MKIVFRATETFIAGVRSDLMRPHAFAHERVGFISVMAAMGLDHLVVMARSYHPVADADYSRNNMVGAMMGQEAIRKALEVALLNRVGMFHVHMHTLPMRLWFSPLDLKEYPKFVPDFFKLRPELPHGAIVLSPHSGAGLTWLGPQQVLALTEFHVVGARTKITRAAADGSTDFFGSTDFCDE
jgi:hypothetical protein